jgi:hypothetical protein
MLRIALCYTAWLTATATAWRFGTNPSWDFDDWFAYCHRGNALVRSEGQFCSIHGLDVMTGCDEMLWSRSNDNDDVYLIVWIGAVVSISPIWQISALSENIWCCRVELINPALLRIKGPYGYLLPYRRVPTATQEALR